MSPSLLLLWVRRESRGAKGRLLFFTACLSIGVAAVVGVSGLVSTFEEGLRSQSRELLAADLKVSGFRRLPDELKEILDAPGVTRTDVRETATMASSATGKSRLVRLKILDGEFPLYGKVVTEPEGDLGTLLTADTVVVAPDLLHEFGGKVGDTVSLGGVEFRVAATVTSEPDAFGAAMAMGPRVFMSGEAFKRTPLLGFGSRLRYQALYRLRGDADEAKAKILNRLPDAEYLQVETHKEAQPTVRQGLSRVGGFLGLVALVSLVLGGLGVSQIVRTWLAGRLGATAILRCLGFRPREVIAIYGASVAALALVGSLIGGVLGLMIPKLIPVLAPDLVPAGMLVGWAWASFFRGLLLGVGVALLFSIPVLLAAGRVSPARVLRADAEPLPPRLLVRVASLLLLGFGLFLAAWLQSEDATIAAAFTGGLFAVAGFLALGAKGVTFLAGRLPRARLNPYLLHGVAALGRPGAGTTGALVALGVGILVVLTMVLVENRLGNELRTALPADAPSTFMVDIQPDQWEEVEKILASEGAVGVKQVPVVMGRLVSVDGRSVDEMAKDKTEDDRKRRRWVLTREQRITWSKELSPDNRIVEGALWTDPERSELSIEKGFADDLGTKVGSTVVFDIQGVPMEFLVSSIRTVQWESFGINFFLVAEPGTLEKAPQIRLAAARLEEAAERRAQDTLAAKLPNVTVIPVREILLRVLGIMERLALGIRFLGSFTIVTGLVILAGAVAATTLRRGRETALLKALGVTRRGVMVLLVVEYALVGLVAGLIGGAGAMILSALFIEHALDLPAELPWIALPITIVASAVATALCGVIASSRALRARPIETLRG